MNGYFLSTYRASELMAKRAEQLLNDVRISLKVDLVLWNNGGPPLITAANPAHDGEVDVDYDFEDSNSEFEEESEDLPDVSFNQLLVDMDVAAKKLAEKFVRTFGNQYLDSLGHGDPTTYSSAMDATSVNNSGLRFGSRSKLRAKVAAELSTSGGGRTRAREHMIKKSISLKTQLDHLIEGVDEVNRRPAVRHYKPLRVRRQKTLSNAAVQLDALKIQILSAEQQLCTMYRQRRILNTQLNADRMDSDDVLTPTAAIGIVVGPRHHYDSITMFEFGTDHSEHEPLKSMFRSIHGIRNDDLSLNDDEARAAKRVRHSIATASGLQLKKHNKIVGGTA